MFWPTAIVLGRVLAEGGAEPPRVEDQSVLLIKRHDIVIGCTPGDGGTAGDAGTDAVPDDGPMDAGVGDAGIGDAGIGDAGTGDGGMCTAIPGDAITMIVQPNVSATADQMRFAVLFVTPERPIVELQQDVFRPLAELTAPVIETKIVEVPDRSLGKVCSNGCGGEPQTYEGGCGGGYDDGLAWNPPGVSDAGLGDGGLIEETLGPYQFVRAQPTSPTQLAGWLDQLGYGYTQADLDAVAPYIGLGFHVVAMRVALKDSSNATLTPVALTWPGSDLRLPAALGRALGAAPSKLTVYIAAEQKYVVPGGAVRFAGDTTSGYLTRNEIMLDQNQPVANDPIAVRDYTGGFQDVITVTKEKHVPVEVPCEQESGCCDNNNRRTRVDLVLVVLAVAFALRRRR